MEIVEGGVLAEAPSVMWVDNAVAVSAAVRVFDASNIVLEIKQVAMSGSLERFEDVIVGSS